MKKTPPGPARFPWRALLYGVILLYLVCDLYWLKGPLRRKIENRKPHSEIARQRAAENGWVATVNGEPVTRRQLDRAVFLYFFRRGKDYSKASALDRRLGRLAALRELVQDALVRQHARAEGFVAATEETERRIAAFESQFPDAGELEERSAAQGLDAEARRRLLAEGITGQLWLEKRIAPAIGVTETEAREWFERNRETGEGFGNPAMVRARHLFISTVTEDTPEREARIRSLHRKLVEEEADFAELAAEFSEDERTKGAGGDLSWFSADRMPADFTNVVFSMEKGELGEPFRTSIGWHVVEITGKEPARRLSFDELKPEIFARIESERRRHAVGVFLEKLETASAIVVFPELMQDETPPATE